ncbi:MULTISPECIES: MerR family transcriptional regulator [Paenibacillus]|uniref:MerR family transcriptional regulator n=1 Tax=Paenibacillus helianthi TaxID=1349432 RepID=A0ABX3ELD7_9BACL|nr:MULTISPECIES: MerR family transcriptional regulator [Paenibacillus]OKP83958.1 MerR family transcriptional regulator [Paenibacillus helianthi]OKP90275.1 MerR family transcriptional regulator [Paenibacillus sp. P3E]OKP97687.1 MerR family transcriptional regulator [Paenibacillus sp. P46E]
MFSINEIVKITGLPASTLRYYEEVGILPVVNRNSGGRREYSEEILEWLELIIALKNTGMTIEEIKAYTDLILQGDETLDARKNFLSAHKMKVEKSVLQTQLHLEKIIRKIAIYDILMYKQTSDKKALL